MADNITTDVMMVESTTRNRNYQNALLYIRLYKQGALDMLFRYSPREQMSKSVLDFSIYGRPVLGAISLMSFIFIILIVKGEKEAFKKYSFLVAHVMFDLISSTIPIFVYLPFFVRKERYMEYRYCELYRTFTVFIPLAFHISSQWIKVVLAFQRFVMFYAPLRAKHLFSKTKMIVCVITTTVVSFPVAVISSIDSRFEISTGLNAAGGALESYCYRNQYKLIGGSRFIVLFLISNFIPIVLLTVLASIFSCQIRARTKTRKSLQKVKKGDDSLDNLNRAVLWSTVLYIITCFPAANAQAFEIYAWATDANMKWIKEVMPIRKLLAEMSIINGMGYINIPVTLGMFVCLNKQTRTRFLELFKMPTLRKFNDQSHGNTNCTTKEPLELQTLS